MTMNWEKVRREKIMQKYHATQPKVVPVQKKVFPASTNVTCPDGRIGRVVNHKQGLNVVIDQFGNVIGNFATSELKIWKT